MKKQGKVKTIPVKEIIGGMQVVMMIKGVGYFVGTIYDKPYHIHWLLSMKNQLLTENEIKQLEILVVEYEDTLLIGQLEEQIAEKAEYEAFPSSVLKTLPLKYSQWQSAIDSGEVNSDKIVEFEIIEELEKNWVKRNIMEGSKMRLRNTKFPIKYAKIIPQKNKKKLYTQEETEKLIAEFVEEMMEKNKSYSNYQQLRFLITDWIKNK